MVSTDSSLTDIDCLEFADGELSNRDRDVVIGMKRLRISREAEAQVIEYTAVPFTLA
jgi:hypothetical protein